MAWFTGRKLAVRYLESVRLILSVSSRELMYEESARSTPVIGHAVSAGIESLFVRLFLFMISGALFHDTCGFVGVTELTNSATGRGKAACGMMNVLQVWWYGFESM